MDWNVFVNILRSGTVSRAHTGLGVHQDSRRTNRRRKLHAHSGGISGSDLDPHISWHTYIAVYTHPDFNNSDYSQPRAYANRPSRRDSDSSLRRILLGRYNRE